MKKMGCDYCTGNPYEYDDGRPEPVPAPAPAAPAEYTCPRCESKISTHICMKAEPVAGDCANQIISEATALICTLKLFLEGDEKPDADDKVRIERYLQSVTRWSSRVMYKDGSGSKKPVSAPAVAAPAEGKPRVFVDMDGVVVDFDSFKNKRGLTGDEVKKLPGAYLEMEPFPEALPGIKALVGSGYDVWLATKPPTGIAYAYSDKAAWVFKHLPELKRKLILTHDKGLLGCARDFLIDDRPHKANCEQFPGTLIRFTNGETWAGVVSKIRNGASTPPTADPAKLRFVEWYAKWPKGRPTSDGLTVREIVEAAEAYARYINGRS